MLSTQHFSFPSDAVAASHPAVTFTCQGTYCLEKNQPPYAFAFDENGNAYPTCYFCRSQEAAYSASTTPTVSMMMMMGGMDGGGGEYGFLDGGNYQFSHNGKGRSGKAPKDKKPGNRAKFVKTENGMRECCGSWCRLPKGGRRMKPLDAFDFVNVLTGELSNTCRECRVKILASRIRCQERSKKALAESKAKSEGLLPVEEMRACSGLYCRRRINGVMAHKKKPLSEFSVHRTTGNIYKACKDCRRRQAESDRRYTGKTGPIRKFATNSSPNTTSPTTTKESVMASGRVGGDDGREDSQSIEPNWQDLETPTNSVTTTSERHDRENFNFDFERAGPSSQATPTIYADAGLQMQSNFGFASAYPTL